MAVLQNIGSAKSPVNLGHGLWAFKRNGHWLYRDSHGKRRFGRNKFIEATDRELMLELEKRGFAVLCPPTSVLIVPTCRALPVRETRFALWAFCRFAVDLSMG